MIKKPILIIVVIILIAFSGFYYINNIFLPVQFKEIVYETAQKTFNQDVKFAHIYYHPFKGFIVKDFVIFRKDDPNLPLIHIKEACFKILFAPLLQRQQIIIPTVTVKQPFVHIIRYPNGLWNLSDLIQARISSAKSPFPVLLGRIQISGGQAEINDLKTDPNLKILADNVSADCRLSLSKGIEFQLKSQLGGPTATVSLRGRFNPVQKSWQGNVTTSNLDTLPVLKMFIHTEKFRPVRVAIATADLNVSGALGKAWQVTGSLSGDLDIGVHTHVIKGTLALQNADFKYAGQTLNYRGGILLDKAEISHDNQKIVQGNISLNAKPLVYSMTEDSLVIQGDIQLTPGYLNPSDQTSLSFSTARLNGFHYHQELYTHILNGEVSASNVKILAPGLAVNTETLTSPIVFSRKGQNVDVTFSPSWRSVSAKMKQKEISAEALQCKLSVLQIVDRNFSLSTTIESTQLNAGFVDEDDNFLLSGNPQVELTVQYFPDDPQPWVCVGKARLNKASLSGLPQAGPLTDINGVVEFTRNRMKTSNLSFEAHGTPLFLSGSLSNFDSPFIGVVVSAKDFDLALLKTFFKKQLEDFNVSPEGKAAVEVSFTGPTAFPEEAQLEINAHLNGVQVQSPRWPEPATGISGFLRYKDGTLHWTDLSVTYFKTPFTLNGEISQFDRPLIATTVLAPDLQASVKLNVNKDTIGIDTFAGIYYQSKFNINGQAFLKASAPVHLNLKTAFSINLEDLERINNPALREKVTPLALQGTVSGKVLFDGDIRDWMAGVTDLNVSGTNYSVAGIAFNRGNLIVQRTRSTQSKINFSGTLYGGDLTINSLLDISEPTFPGKFSITMNQVDLAQVRQNPRWEKLNLAGTLSSRLQAEGPLLKSEEITGQGSLAILNGHLWTLSFLKGLGKLLFIPELENVVFTEGRADVTIKNNRISTENLLLQSKQMELRGKGWIDRNKNISWDIVPRLYETEILRSDSLKKIPTALISQTDGYINIKIRGTMDNPVRTVENFPTKLLKKTAEGILEGVQGIFEEILQ